MRKILLIALLSSFSFYCQSQISTPQKELPSIVVGKIAPMGMFMAELSYNKNTEEAGDSTYIFRFKNQQYSKIVSIESVSFSSIDNTVNQLYTILKSVFLDENKSNKDYKISFTLGKDVVIISNYKFMGATAAMFFNKNGYVCLRESQIDKLFGK